MTSFSDDKQQALDFTMHNKLHKFSCSWNLIAVRKRYEALDEGKMIGANGKTMESNK